MITQFFDRFNSLVKDNDERSGYTFLQYEFNEIIKYFTELGQIIDDWKGCGIFKFEFAKIMGKMLGNENTEFVSGYSPRLLDQLTDDLNSMDKKLIDAPIWENVNDKKLLKFRV